MKFSSVFHTPHLLMSNNPLYLKLNIFSVIAAETESLYTKVTQTILDRYGKTFEWSLKSRIMGRPPLVGARMVIDSLQLPLDPQVFLDELHEKLELEFPHASLMPGLF